MAFDPSLVPDSQKLKLTLDSTPISADQTDFPLTVVLDGTDPLHAAVFEELSWTPDQISTALWLDAADSSTITIDAGVSQWGDKSGNNRHATQGTTSLQPAYSAGAFGGRGGVIFSSDLLSVTYTTEQTSSFSFFCVLDNSSSTARQYVFASGINVSDTNKLLVGFTTDTSAPGYYDGVAWRKAGSFVSGQQTIAWMMDKDGGTAEIMRDGSSLGSVTYSPQKINNNVQIGGRSDTSHYFNGTIAEIIVVEDALNTETRQIIEGYLAHKWGLTASLPADHPYKTSAPTVPEKLSIQSGTTQLPVEIEHWEPPVEPVSHWTMDNVYGSTLVDEKGVNDGTITNMTQTVGGKFGNYLLGGLRSVVRNVSFVGGGGIQFKSISMWIKRTNLNNGCVLLYNGIELSTLAVNNSGSGNLLCVYSGGWIYSNLTVSDTDWHHIVLVEGSTNNNHWFFVDGVKSSSEINTKLGGWFGYFGTLGTLASSEVSNFDNIQLFNVKLTDSQVIDLYNATSQDRIPGGKAVLHTKVPTYAAAADGELILSYDSSQDDNDSYVGETGSTPAQYVWDSNFAAVYHMAQDPSVGGACILDSTANANHGTPAGSMTSGDLIDGDIGKAIEFDGSNDYLSLNSNLGLTTYPIVFIFQFQVPNLNDLLCLLSCDTGGKYRGVRIEVGTTGKFAVTYGDGGGAGPDDRRSFATTDGIISAGVNYTIILSIIGVEQHALYVNGVNVPLLLSSGTGGAPDWINARYVIGTDIRGATSYFNGIISFVAFGSFSVTADLITLLNLSLTDQLITWSAYDAGGPPTSVFIQNYSITDNRLQILQEKYYLALLSSLIQSYSLLGYLKNHLIEVWSNRLGVDLVQYYGDSDNLISILVQYYQDTRLPTRVLRLLYEDALAVLNSYNIQYIIYDSPLGSIKIPYTITDFVVQNLNVTQYDLLSFNPALRTLRELYLPLDADSVIQQDSFTVTVRGGVLIDVESIDIDASISDFRKHCQLEVTKDTFYNCNHLDSLRVTVNNIDFDFIIIMPTRNFPKVGEGRYTINAYSKAILLTEPYSRTISQEFTPNMASTIVSTLAALKDVTIEWNIVDWYISANKLYAEDDSPLEIIQKVVKVAGGILQSSNDGTLRVEYKYKRALSNTSVPPDLYLSASENFFNINESSVEKPGYNRYFVTDSLASSESISIEEIDIDRDSTLYRADTKYLAGYVVPWSGAPASLTTSSIDVSSIQYMGIVTEVIEQEQVEFVNGTGSTSKPIYSLGPINWKDTSLGNVLHNENGTLEAEFTDGPTDGCSIALVTYTTKYYKWKVVSSDFVDDIQFILTVED
jgi:hypothetical protein